MKVTVLYNLPESDLVADFDTEKSANLVCGGLQKNYNAEVFGIHKNEIYKVKDIKADFVFNLVEWSGLDSQLGCEVINSFEEMSLPYSGSNAWGYELSCDKRKMKKLMLENNILTPNWFVVDSKSSFPAELINFPAIVKPAIEHCGIGIDQASVVGNDGALRVKCDKLLEQFNYPVLVEEYIDGREIHVTILEKDGEPWVLPPAEVFFDKKPGFIPILSYDAKWNEDSDEYGMSKLDIARLGSGLENKINKIATDCYTKLGGRDYPRLDIRIKDNEIFVLEINNNPGIDFDAQSGIGASARAAGFDWESFLKHIVDNAYRRFV